MEDRAAWQKAKKKCGLIESEVRMAKELGLSPDTLIHNIPSGKEKWKYHRHSGSDVCMKKQRKEKIADYCHV